MMTAVGVGTVAAAGSPQHGSTPQPLCEAPTTARQFCTLQSSPRKEEHQYPPTVDEGTEAQGSEVIFLS